ncbi:hypothetical protein KCU77_g55, partial [Aureobasidium melanogenum]
MRRMPYSRDSMREAIVFRSRAKIEATEVARKIFGILVTGSFQFGSVQIVIENVDLGGTVGFIGLVENEFQKLFEGLNTIPQVLDAVLAEYKKFLKLTSRENISGGDDSDRGLCFWPLVVSSFVAIRVGETF